MEHIEPRLQALADMLGLPSLALDAQGLRSISIDRHPVFHLQVDADAREAVLYAVVGSLKPGGSVAAENLLRANRFWRGTGGATLSLDSGTPPRVILAQRVPCVALTPVQFAQAVRRFIDQALFWQEELDDDVASPAGGAQPSPSQFA